jgi:hypothetical protein
MKNKATMEVCQETAHDLLRVKEINKKTRNRIAKI